MSAATTGQLPVINGYAQPAQYAPPAAPYAQQPTLPLGRSHRSTTVGPSDRVVPRPGSGGKHVRQMLRLAFWGGMAVAVGVWWLGTPPGSVDSLSTGLIEAGRITGMVAGYTLLIQILLMTRVGWLDRRVSANELLMLHRDLGGLLVVTVVTHAALLIVGYAGSDGVGWWSETTTMLNGYQDMISAFVATGLLIGIGLLSVKAIRALLSYEAWYYTHLTTYGVLLLGYGHQFADGRDLSQPGLARTLWLSLYLFVLASLVWGRVVHPIRLNLRHQLRVAEVTHEGQDMFSVYIRGRKLHLMQARAGQFFRWRFLTRSHWTQAHPFSLSAAPNGQWLRLTIKAVGDHTEQLKWLEPGVRIFAEGPSGVFTADRRVRHRALLIAGGSGIAPIRALLEELPRGTIVIYRASSADDLIFKQELDWLAEARDTEIYYVVGSRDDPGPRKVMSPKGMRQLVPDISRRDVYLCGPEGLITSAVGILKRLHVPRRQIHLDPFSF
jgi:predicted ferric reductase